MAMKVPLDVWHRQMRIVIRTLLTKAMEYSSMAAPIYASWATGLDIYHEKNIR
jgi:hypothetical protein